MQIDDAQVGIIRAHLRSQNVAGANNPLNLVGAAGAVLVSSLVQQGVIAAARGIEVYTANQQNPPHTALAGGQPIRLWLSGGHFQAIVPG
jgi:hypothetical protein